MKGRRFWEIGGFVAGGLLILFGVVAIALGVNGYSTTRDSIKGEGITFGTTDDPAVAKYASQWAVAEWADTIAAALSGRDSAHERYDPVTARVAP
jgi:hypothetical protein